MANFYGVFVTLVTVWTVLNKPDEVQGQRPPCSPFQEDQCVNTGLPPGARRCFTTGPGPNDFKCNCDGHPSSNIGRLCTTPIPQNVACTAVTGLDTCYGCAQNYFTSINHPELYESGRRDVYLIYVPGAREINFEFSAPFSVETKKDDLFVGAGLEFSAVDIVARPAPGVISLNRLYYFDNRIITPPGRDDPIPGATPDPFTIIGDTAWVYFRSDRNCEGVGFNLTWSAENIPPVVVCPTSVVVESFPGNIGQVADWITTCTDSADGTITTTVCNPAPGSFFSGVGTNIVTCTCTDSAAASSQCNFPVTVTGVITCPAPVVVTSLSNNVGNSATWDPPTCVDAEDGTIVTSFCVPASGSFFSGVGVNTVTCTCTDSGGLSDECTFPVTIQGVNTSPLTTCPAPVVVTSLANNVGNSATWDPPTCVDARDGFITTSVCVPVSGSFFPGVGVNTVSCTCTDSGGLSDICTFPVIVEGFNSPPVITCPDPVAVTSLANNVGNSATWEPPTCVDAQDGTITTSVCVPTSGSFFPGVGVNMIICTCTDRGGLSDECIFRVTVADIEPPMLLCPGNIVVTVPSGVNSIPIQWSLPIVSDISEPVRLVSASHNPGAEFPVGTTTVRYEYADAFENAASCTFDIRVMIESPCAVNFCSNGGTCVAVNIDRTSCVCPRCFTGDFCQTAVDVCSGNMCSFGSTCVPVPDSCEQYTCNCPPCFTGPFCNIGGDVCAGNECNNGGVCQADPTDCTLYTCICPACFSGPFCQIRANGCSPNPCQNNAVCTDLSATECNAYRCDCVGCFDGFNCERVANGCSPNPCQNNAVCTDLSAIECNTYRCDCVGCFDGFNCERAIPNPCNQNPCLNGGTCTRNVQLCASYTCQCPPGFEGDTCQTRSVIFVNPCNSFPCENGGSCSSQESDTNYVCICPQGYAGINCGMIAAPGANLCLGNPCQNGGSCFASYYSGSSSFMYTPQYMCLCAVGFTGNNCQFNVFAVPSQDVCSMEPGVCQNGGICTNTFNSFTGDVDFKCTNCLLFAVGKTCEVIVPDACLSSPCINSGTCVTERRGFRCICNSAFQGTFCQIPGLDFQPPVISGCPGDFSQMGPSPVIFRPPQATDNSGYVRLLFMSHTPGQVFPIGITTVSFVFGDAAGNQNQCTFYVTVTDGGLPFYIVVSNCPGNIVAQTSGSSANVMFETPTAVSRDGGVSLVSQSHNSGSSFPVGTTSVSFIFRDAAGNQAECNFDVTVTTVDDCFRVCTLQFNPVCGSNDMTYDNLCEFGVAQCRVPSLSFTSGACIDDPCSSSPCLGGGSCFRTGSGNNFLCLCPAGRSGDRCEIVIGDPCFRTPCQNDGTCVSVPGMNNFVCLCVPGFSGALCEQDVTPCDPNPCLGGGICFQLVDDSFVCVCPEGRTGQRCQNTAQRLTVDTFLCQDRTVTIPPQNTFVLESVIVPNATFNGVIVPPTSFGGAVMSLTTTNYFLAEGSTRFIYNYEFRNFTATCDFTISVIASSQVGKRSVDETEMFGEEVSLCNPNPCLNEGQCHLLLNEDDTTPVPYCECVEGWSGPMCATSVSYVSHFHETVEMWTLLVILVVVLLTFTLMVCRYQRCCFQGRRYQDEKAVIQ